MTAELIKSFQALRVLVVGLGRFGGGVGVTRWLASQGAHVVVSDQAGETDLAESVRQIADLDVELRLGGHGETDLDGCDLVVINPAVDKLKSAYFQKIVRRDLPWTTELNLFCERCPAVVVGVTGSFGKSTTSAMIAAGLEAAANGGRSGPRRVHLGGNIGNSLLDSLNDMTAHDVVVLELSSAQLEDAPRIDWAPDVAVITNIRPHHLDRHGTYEAYIDAKLNITRRPRDSRTGHLRTESLPLVLGALDDVTRLMLERRVLDSARRLVRVSPLPEDFRLKAPGDHNRVNAACALAAIEAAGFGCDEATSAVATFPGLPHRLEHVSVSAGVNWINDSKSTAPSATVTALRALNGRSVLAIVGGQRKEGVSYEELAEELLHRCRAVICFGEAGPAIAATITSHQQILESGSVPVRVAGRVDDALQTAAILAQEGDSVLFSPGTPSFDAFHNYADRGRRFVELVRTLPSAELLKPG